MNLPNKLTICRIILVIPYIIILTFLKLNMDNYVFWIVSGILFAIAMFTDYLDGYLARKNNQVTSFGKLFDPLADKFITSVSLIMLSIMEIVPFYISLVFILRDLLVDGSRNIAAKHNLQIAASWIGKWKTFLMSIGFLVIFFVVPFIKDYEKSFLNPSWQIWIILTPLNVAALLSTISGYQYFKIIVPHIKSNF